MVILKNNQQYFDDDTFMESFLKNEEAKCILYSKEGVKFNIHREILYQTEFMRNILQSAHTTCCGNVNIFCPCSEEELECIVNFLYRGKISFGQGTDLSKILDNLKNTFGFPDKLYFEKNCDNNLGIRIENKSEESELDVKKSGDFTYENGCSIKLTPKSDITVERTDSPSDHETSKHIGLNFQKKTDLEKLISNHNVSIIPLNLGNATYNSCQNDMKQKEFQCEKCNKSFNSKSKLKFHKKVSHDQFKKTFANENLDIVNMEKCEQSDLSIIAPHSDTLEIKKEPILNSDITSEVHLNKLIDVPIKSKDPFECTNCKVKKNWLLSSI